MGRDKSKYFRKSIKDQMQEKLEGMMHIGESKKQAKSEGTSDDKIFSYATYQSYRKHLHYFANWLAQKHPEITSLKKAQKVAVEWLEERANQTDEKGEHLSAWTLQLESKAINKLFQIKPGDKDYWEPPKRERVNIKRSRGGAERDRHFSEENNRTLIDFCMGTGLRRSEIEHLKPEQLYSWDQVKEIYDGYVSGAMNGPDMKALSEAVEVHDAFLASRERRENGEVPEYFLRIVGKGGRVRYSPIVGENITDIVKKITETDNGKNVWGKVHTAADIHDYRSKYSVYVYKAVARPIEDIPYDGYNRGIKQKVQKDVYICRKDENGRKLDKKAMEIASKTLGHSRIEIIANNYLRNM